MKATSHLRPFLLADSAVRVDGGAVSLLRRDAVKAGRADVPTGHLAGAFDVSQPEDLHPDTWELHPEGDEVLLMLGGEIVVECADGARRDATPLPAGHGIVIPAGTWHRLRLRAPGRLVALTPARGTRLAWSPGESATSIPKGRQP